MRKVWPSDEILHKNLLPLYGLEVDSGIVVRISFPRVTEKEMNGAVDQQTAVASHLYCGWQSRREIC